MRNSLKVSARRRHTGRPQLLFLCQTLPYPPDGGVWIRTYHVLRLLARAFDITALCFERTESRHRGGEIAAGLDVLRRFAKVDVFPVPQKHSRLRYAWDHLRSAALGRVYTEFVYESRAFRTRLAELLDSTAFDLVHADSLVDLVRYLPVCDRIPLVGVHHNVESDLLRRRAAIEPSGSRRAYLAYQARLMERVERTWCRRVALNVAVSAPDRAALKQIAPDARVIVVPNGVDVDEFRPAAADGAGVAYVGGMNRFPNRDALEFFCGQILPHLRMPQTHIPVRWIGAASAEQQRSYREEHGIELTGYVDDVKPFMHDAACHIVPLRVGGGTRLKILNAWAMGKPVVSTSIGCEGLAAVDGENILVRDDPKEFADAVLAVLRDDDLHRRLGDGGRETAERIYSWDRVGADMIAAYSTVRTRATGVFAPDRMGIRVEASYSHE
jgi:glycosyltransferase involved in cell wall biosynthesis